MSDIFEMFDLINFQESLYYVLDKPVGYSPDFYEFCFTSVGFLNL